MFTIYLDNLQISFIIVAPIIVLLVVFLILYKPVKNKLYQKNYHNYYGKKVYKTALYEDFYLINNFVFSYEEGKGMKIDHVLFGNKYIYLINDYYYDGSLSGQEKDGSLILITKSGKKSYVDNPLMANKIVSKRLSIISNFDKSMLISIALVNKECSLEIEHKEKNNYLIQVDKLYKLVRAIESRDIAPIEPDQLQRAVKDMDRLNKKGYARRVKKSA